MRLFRSYLLDVGVQSCNFSYCQSSLLLISHLMYRRGLPHRVIIVWIWVETVLVGALVRVSEVPRWRKASVTKILKSVLRRRLVIVPWSIKLGWTRTE